MHIWNVLNEINCCVKCIEMNYFEFQRENKKVKITVQRIDRNHKKMQQLKIYYLINKLNATFIRSQSVANKAEEQYSFIHVSDGITICECLLRIQDNGFQIKKMKKRKENNVNCEIGCVFCQSNFIFYFVLFQIIFISFFL